MSRRIEQLLPLEKVETVSVKGESRYEIVKSTDKDYKQHVMKIWTDYTSDDHPYVISFLDVANESAHTIDNNYYINALTTINNK